MATIDGGKNASKHSKGQYNKRRLWTIYCQWSERAEQKNKAIVSDSGSEKVTVSEKKTASPIPNKNKVVTTSGRNITFFTFSDMHITASNKQIPIP